MIITILAIFGGVVLGLAFFSCLLLAILATMDALEDRRDDEDL